MAYENSGVSFSFSCYPSRCYLHHVALACAKVDRGHAGQGTRRVCGMDTRVALEPIHEAYDFPSKFGKILGASIGNVGQFGVSFGAFLPSSTSKDTRSTTLGRWYRVGRPCCTLCHGETPVIW